MQGLIFEAGRLEPITRQVAPTWMGAITVLTETGFAGEMRAVTDVRIAAIAPEDFTRLALSQRPVHPPRDARDPSGGHADRGARAESRAAWRRSARWRPGSRTS